MDHREKFENIYRRLTKTIFLGRSHLNVWKLMAEEEEKEPDTMKIAQTFFYLTSKANFETSILHLSRLLDNHKDSVNIWYYLDFIQSNHPNIFPNEYAGRIKKGVKRDKERLEELKTSIANLREWRNKRYAHFAKQILSNPNQIFAKYSLKVSELEEMYRSTSKIINHYTEFCDIIPVHGELLGDADVKSLFRIINKYKYLKKNMAKV